METPNKLVEYSDSDSETDKTTPFLHQPPPLLLQKLLPDSPNQCHLIVVLF